MIEADRVEEIKETLEKLRGQAFEAAECLRTAGKSNVADNLLLNVGYVTGVIYKELPKDDLIMKGEET